MKRVKTFTWAQRLCTAVRAIRCATIPRPRSPTNNSLLAQSFLVGSVATHVLESERGQLTVLLVTLRPPAVSSHGPPSHAKSLTLFHASRTCANRTLSSRTLLSNRITLVCVQLGLPNVRLLQRLWPSCAGVASTLTLFIALLCESACIWWHSVCLRLCACEYMYRTAFQCC